MMGIDEKFGIKGKEVILVECYGVKVILMVFFVEENVLVIWRGLMLGKMLMNFFIEVKWGDIEYLIFDFLFGIGDVVLDVYMMLFLSKEIIVMIFYFIVVFVVVCVGVMVKYMDYFIFGVIENMSYFESKEMGNKEYVFGKGGGIKLVDEFNI